MTAVSVLADAERCLHDADTAAALGLLQSEVRAHPGDARLRTFLFQLLSVRGEWKRALEQLKTAGQLDAAALPMVQTYREALHCELLRAQVMSGQKSPLVVGEPPAWIGLLVESLVRAGRGDASGAAALREQAFEQAAPSTGTVDGKPFAWIADADVRFGPVLEAILTGGYYWVPFEHVRRIVLQEPVDLRDLVWAPAHLELANGGETAALIPARYPGTEAADEGALQLGRRTIWQRVGGAEQGVGQRLLATDADEYALLDVREIVIDPR